MSNTTNPMAGFIRKMNVELFNKIAHGQFDVEEDMRQLNKYLDLAHQINSPEAAGNVYLTIFFLQIAVGQFEAAIATIEKGVQEFERSQFKQRALGCRINQGETYFILGDVEKAIEVYAQTLLALEQQSDEEDHFGDRFILYASLGTSYLAHDDEDIAEQFFHRILESPEKTQNQYTNAVIEAYIGLAEVHLKRDELDETVARANLAWDIVQRQNDPRRAFLVQCTLGHIAERIDSPQVAETHYQAAIETLKPTLKSAYNIAALLHEARYQHRHQNVEQAARFATLAQQYFHAIDVHIFDEELTRLMSA